MSDNLGSSVRSLDRIFESEPEYCLSSLSDHHMSPGQIPRGYSSSASPQPDPSYRTLGSCQLPSIERLSIQDEGSTTAPASNGREYRVVDTTFNTAVMSFAGNRLHHDAQAFDGGWTASAVTPDELIELPCPAVAWPTQSWAGNNSDPNLQGVGSHVVQWRYEHNQNDSQTSAPVVSANDGYISDAESHLIASPALSTMSLHVQPSRSIRDGQRGEEHIVHGDPELDDVEHDQRQRSADDRRKTRRYRVDVAGRHVSVQHRDIPHVRQPGYGSHVNEAIPEHPYISDANMQQYQLPGPSTISPYPVLGQPAVAPEWRPLDQYDPGQTDFHQHSVPDYGGCNGNSSTAPHHAGNDYNGGGASM